MQIRELAEKLKSIYTGTQSHVVIDEEVLKVKLFHEDLKVPEPGTLYALEDNLSFIKHRPAGNYLRLSDEYPDDCSSYNLICLHTDDSFIKVFNRLQDIIADANRYVKGSTSLLDCIIKGKELRDVIETGFEILGNPIMLMDTSYKVLAYKTNETINDPVWSDLVEHGYSSRKFVSLFKSEHIIEKILKNDMPIILDTGVAETIRRILGKIMLNGSCKGYLAVLEYNHTFSDQEVHITRLICEVISSLMQSGSNRMTNTAGLMFENIIQDLLEKRIEDEATLAGRLHACDWQPGSRIIAVTVDMCKYNDVSFIDFFRNKLSIILPGAKSVYYDDALVVVLDVDNKTLASNSHMFDILEQFITENDLLAGISLIFDDLLLLPQYHRQSKRAISIGQVLCAGSRMFEYRDFAVDDFVCESAKYFDVMDFCHKAVLDIKEFDDKKNTEYFVTLYAYLIHDKNVIETAEALYIHRNTVKYRIDKIEEIIGFSLKDSKETFQMLLTYKLLTVNDLLENVLKHKH